MLSDLYTLGKDDTTVRGPSMDVFGRVWQAREHYKAPG